MDERATNLEASIFENFEYCSTIILNQKEAFSVLQLCQRLRHKCCVLNRRLNRIKRERNIWKKMYYEQQKLTVDLLKKSLENIE